MVAVQASVCHQQEATESPVPGVSSLQAVLAGHVEAPLQRGGETSGARWASMSPVLCPLSSVLCPQEDQMPCKGSWLGAVKPDQSRQETLGGRPASSLGPLKSLQGRALVQMLNQRQSSTQRPKTCNPNMKVAAGRKMFTGSSPSVSAGLAGVSTQTSTISHHRSNISRAGG